MTTPDHQSPTPDASRPESKDRIYRSPAGMAGGALVLALVGWLGIDALVSGNDRVPWLALAGMILIIPLVSAFTLRPAVYANEDRLRIRNPWRVIVLPWAKVASLKSGYSNEAVDTTGAKYQLWAVPVSLRGRKKVARQQARSTAPGGRGRTHTAVQEPTPAQTDQIMGDLRELARARGAAEGSQGEVSVRWAYEVIAPVVAGAVLLAVLLAMG
ncbi:PH domain-containing protein [Streptomyces sp. NPDC093544]|uniref:PH domain-containing protein n=1 Tax=Streptomyces sp. NPDC093544 TaxID=3155200 RepID=UPI00342280CD